MAARIDIVATGARTPLGLHAASAAAACRAEISAIKHHPFMVDSVGDLMPGALDARLDPRVRGPRRLLLLADAAVREACQLLAGLERRFSIPVYMALSEIRPGFSATDAEEVRRGVAALEGLPAELSEVRVFVQGHAGGLVALAHAMDSAHRGGLDICLVGGVASYFEADTMEWLDGNRQLIGEVSRTGFAPGEGAAFCLLMSEGLRRRLHLPALSRLASVAVARESKLIKSDAICLGEGLSAAVGDAIIQLDEPARRINAVICDINGERYRSEEWGFSCLRLGQYFDAPTAYLSPADCWGDMDAASGPLFAMLACEAYARGYAKGPRTLLWASSECGQRAAAVLEAPELR